LSIFTHAIGDLKIPKKESSIGYVDVYVLLKKREALSLVQVTIDCYGLDNANVPLGNEHGRPFFLLEDFKHQIGD
jgi:hypothetical protein